MTASDGHRKGISLVALNRFAEAIECYDKALALDCANQVLACDPSNVAGWDLKGTLLAELGRPAEAVPCHQEARKLDPRDPRLAYNLGNAWAMMERFGEAIAAYEDSARLAPDMPVTWYNLALSTFRAGRQVESVPLFERYLAFDRPNDGLRRTAERLSSGIRAGRKPSVGPVRVGARINPEEQATIDAKAA